MEGSRDLFTNVYSSCHLLLKKRFWRDLISLKNRFGKGIGLYGGDFNVVACSKERKMVSEGRRRGKMVEFSRFIEELICINVPSVGGPFTWFNRADTSMTRLDRFFIS